MTLGSNTTLAVRLLAPVVKLTKATHLIASNQASRPGQHWGMAEVLVLVDAPPGVAGPTKGERNALLIQSGNREAGYGDEAMT